MLFSLSTLAVFTTAITTAVAQDIPNPPLGGSDCRMQREASFYFSQVVLRTDANYDEMCTSFQNAMNDACSGVVVTCMDDADPQLKYYMFEGDADCDGAAVEGVIRAVTDESEPFCNVTG